MNTVEKILDLIKKQGITEKKFLEDLGLPKTTLSNWKSGQNSSYKDHIVKIADYFGVTTDYLLRDGETNKIKLIKSEEKEMVKASIVEFGLSSYFRTFHPDCKQFHIDFNEINVDFDDLSKKARVPIDRLKIFYESIKAEDAFKLTPTEYPTFNEFNNMLLAKPEAREEKMCTNLLQALKKETSNLTKEESDNIYVTKDEFKSLENKVDKILGLLENQSKKPKAE